MEIQNHADVLSLYYSYVKCLCESDTQDVGQEFGGRSDFWREKQLLAGEATFGGRLVVTLSVMEDLGGCMHGD